MNRVVSSPAAITLGAGGKAAQYANLWMHLPSSPPPTPPRAKPRQEQDAGVGAGTETESDDDDERADRGLAQERAFVARGGPRTLEWACAKERVRGRTTDDGDGAMEKGLESAHAQAQVGEKRRRSVASLLSSDPPSMPSRLAATSAPSSVRVPPPAQTIATSSPVPLTSKSAPPSPPPPRTDEMKEMADLLCQLARGPGRPQSTAAATS
ncbi:hypothetical protein BKA62DRAFT_715134 [Auriculariales sp. MPI-PUGE-AT-0066]|nr:hypothetical protein BKA62DRAFT_715134 [Auriculariales sp. MPI-PUGE-AT-0066]